MNDITALMATVKAAAEKAIADEGSTWWSEEQLASDYGLSLHPADAKFIALASHENVKALVEALEKAQQYAKERDEENQSLMLTVGRLRVERESLESRTVTVKLPDYRNSPDMHTKQYYETIGFNQGLDACEIVLRAAGIQVIEGDA
ncbi:ead/Ea22-like family protein [Kluyvera ascorbata]|uniref:ead/Ea22-like family protein n=1 Tax=Kluyvera ascorbata TaxID=51288 RepID=UPI00374DD7F7